jgi:histidinol-phosphate phosphatase family protein
LQAVSGLGKIFGRVFVVTNQRGVGLGLMSEETLNEIHDKMLAEVNVVSGMVEKIYYCIDVDQSSVCRKPNIGMGLKAKIEFPEIDFSKSVMVGDSISDMLFGKNLGMKTIFVGKKSENNKLDGLIYFDSLLEFYRSQIV